MAMRSPYDRVAATPFLHASPHHQPAGPGMPKDAAPVRSRPGSTRASRSPVSTQDRTTTSTTGPQGIIEPKMPAPTPVPNPQPNGKAVTGPAAAERPVNAEEGLGRKGGGSDK